MPCQSGLRNTQPRRRKILRPPAAAILLIAAVLSGCAFDSATPPRDPFSLQAAWFDYLGGEEIRAACSAGTAEGRTRLVYNARYEDRAMGFDVHPLATGGARLDQLVAQGVTLRSGAQDILAPVTVPTAQATLSETEREAFEALLVDSGVFDGSPVGERLVSLQHYWIVSGCRDGDFFLTAFRYPRTDFHTLTFAPFLRTRNQTGVPFPDDPDGGDLVVGQSCPPRGDARRNEATVCFTVTVGDNRLRLPF